MAKKPKAENEALVPDKRFTPFRTQRIDWRTGKVLETITIDLQQDLKIGRDLQKALRTSMSTYAFYAQLKEMAHVKMKQCRYKVHCVSETLYLEIRVNEAKLTETAIKNRIHVDPRWRKYTRRYMLWRDRYRMLHEICVALKDRNENLRTLEASERRERDGKY